MEKRQNTLTNTHTKRKILGPCSYILTAAETGRWRMERPCLEEKACIRCGICAKYCPTACISVKQEGFPLEFDWNYCKGCGICANECPKQALSMIQEGSVNNGN